jgi:hypothetical protein
MSEGSKAILSAVNIALSRVTSLTFPQLAAIRQALLAMEADPSFDLACDYINQMERTGLNVEPDGFGLLAEILCTKGLELRP